MGGTETEKQLSLTEDEAATRDSPLFKARLAVRRQAAGELNRLDLSPPIFFSSFEAQDSSPIPSDIPALPPPNKTSKLEHAHTPHPISH